MPLQPNDQLLHFRLIEQIGEGGMGVVWKATDTTLDREVAIKVLPDVVVQQAERLARFEREAKILASLNHPGIAAVHSVHEVEGVRFLSMELVPGEDLQQRLKRGPLPVDEALAVARQVAEALEAAHERGVIHRDLKPANIKVTPEGQAKVLDLGLAKALDAEMSGDGPSVSLSPTMTTAGTIAGTLLGTAGYMSPEQAKGRPVDRRADIWAFGVVLCEMLTGKPMFQADTISETLAAVLRDEVAFDGLPEGTPSSVRTLLRRCLERDQRMRLRDIGEARIALLEDALSADASVAGEVAAGSATEVTTSRRLGALPWVLVAALAAVAAFSFWRPTDEPVTESEVFTLVAPIPSELEMPVIQEGVMALSPDGKTLALVLRRDNIEMLYVRKLDSDELVEMPGTENAVTPFFSPDGAWIGFFADDKLKKVPTAGGNPMTLCDADGSNRGATWGTDDMITFSPHYTRPLMRVTASGGEATHLTTIDSAKGERTHRWPHAVPGEDLVLFTVGTIDSPENYDAARIEAVRPSTGERIPVLERASMARYVPTGHLVFGRDGFLFAVGVDIDTLKLRGDPIPVRENVKGARGSGVVHAGFAGNSGGGLLAYVASTARSRQDRMVWRNRDGSMEPVGSPLAGYGAPRLSPDRTQIVAAVRGNATADVWTYRLEQGTFTRLTFEGDNRAPVWSPDGRRVAFSSVRGNSLTSGYAKAADGSGPAELLVSPEQVGLQNAGNILPRGWTPDGRQLIVEYSDENMQNIGVITEDGELLPLVNTPATESIPRLSPNGRWLAYLSDETGEFEVFVQAFPGPGGRWQVSNTGGIWPHWSPDGTELFYRSDSFFYSVRVDDSSSSFSGSRPEVIFDDLPSTSGMDYDVFDSDRFLFVENVADDAAAVGVTVVVNWLDELERRVGD